VEARVVTQDAERAAEMGKVLEDPALLLAAMKAVTMVDITQYGAFVISAVQVQTAPSPPPPPSPPPSPRLPPPPLPPRGPQSMPRSAPPLQSVFESQLSAAGHVTPLLALAVLAAVWLL
jgi:hypothetical protein